MSLKALTDGSELPPLQPGVLRLYGMKFCPFVRRTRLVLEAKRIPFETVNIHLKNKPKWFLEKTPLGKVPVLEKDEKIVYESLICNEYLDEVYPPKLHPQDPYQRARDMMLVERSGKLISNFYTLLRCLGKDEEALGEFLSGSEPLEDELGKRGKFFGGDRPGMLDYNLWPYYERHVAVFHLVEGLEARFKEKYPRITDWIGRMLDDHAVKACFIPDETHLAYYKTWHTGNPNYDL